MLSDKIFIYIVHNQFSNLIPLLYDGRMVDLYLLSRNNLIFSKIYVSLQLLVQNAVSAQPCVGKLGISLVLLNFLHCNF